MAKSTTTKLFGFEIIVTALNEGLILVKFLDKKSQFGEVNKRRCCDWSAVSFV